MSDVDDNGAKPPGGHELVSAWLICLILIVALALI